MVITAIAFILLGILITYLIVCNLSLTFKCSYYETKLVNRRSLIGELTYHQILTVKNDFWSFIKPVRPATKNTILLKE